MFIIKIKKKLNIVSTLGKPKSIKNNIIDKAF